MARRLSDTEIAARIVPTMVRWPGPDVAKTIAWDRLRDSVGALRGLVRVIDDNCFQAEQDTDLSSEGITRRRMVLGRQALGELEQFKPFIAAERATRENIDYLEKKMTDLPQAPSAIADVMMAQEIRQFIRSQNSPVDVAFKAISNPRILAAVLTAPPFLSGLTDTHLNVLHQQARTALHPEQTQMQQQLSKALDDVREGIEATKRLVAKRCQLNAVADDLKEKA